MRDPNPMRRKADGSLPTITKRRMLVWFAALLVVQGLHSVEHVMQLVQRYVLHEPSPQGLLGRWTNLEWMHLAYNVALGALLVAMFVRFRMWRRAWRSPLLGWIALVAATAFQLGLHVPEHAVRIYEFLRYGWNPAPGILGHTPLHGTGPFDPRAAWEETRSFFYLGVTYVLACNLLETRAQLRIFIWLFVAAIGLKSMQGLVRFAYVRANGLQVDAITGHEDVVFFSAFVLLLA